MAGGQCIGMPDTCLTPAPPSPSPIPIPYPNIANVNIALSTSQKLMIGNMPAVVENSEVPVSSGDEAGVSGGIMSGCIVGKAVFKVGSMKLDAEGKAVCYHTGMVTQNGPSPNVPASMQQVPSQFFVFVEP
jgi:hypothetical protein